MNWDERERHARDVAKKTVARLSSDAQCGKRPRPYELHVHRDRVVGRIRPNIRFSQSCASEADAWLLVREMANLLADDAEANPPAPVAEWDF